MKFLTNLTFDEAALAKALQPQLEKFVSELNEHYEKFARQHAGKPADSIQPLLERFFEERSITRPGAVVKELAKEIEKGIIGTPFRS